MIRSHKGYALLPILASCAVFAARGDDDELDVRDVAARAKIGLGDAIELALKAQPGSAVEADLEAEVHDKATDFFYEIMIVAPDGKSLFEVLIDPISGKVKSAGQATESDDLGELPGFVDALSHSKKTLHQMVDAASEIVKGQAVGAGLEDEHGAASCDVAFVHARYLIEVEVEAKGATLREIELKRGGDEDDEHADKGDENDDEHADHESGDEEDDD